MTSDETPAIVSYDDAVAMLPDGDTIHTFRGSLPMMIGADWPREGILSALAKTEVIQLSGPVATGMGHGLVVFDGGSYLFIETKKG